MYYHVIEAKYLREYKVWVRFKDGKDGEIDLSNDLDGPIFEPLKKVEYFKNFNIEGNTLHWGNGADYAPEYLYELVTRNVLTR